MAVYIFKIFYNGIGGMRLCLLLIFMAMIASLASAQNMDDVDYERKNLI